MGKKWSSEKKERKREIEIEYFQSLFVLNRSDDGGWLARIEGQSNKRGA